MKTFIKLSFWSILDAVEFQLSSDRRTGRPIACAVVKVDESSYEVISEDRFTGTVVQEARVSKSKNVRHRICQL